MPPSNLPLGGLESSGPAQSHVLPALRGWTEASACALAVLNGCLHPVTVLRFGFFKSGRVKR